MKKINGLLVAVVLFTAVSLACQLSSVDLPELETDSRPDFPEFISPERGNNRANPLSVVG